MPRLCQTAGVPITGTPCTLLGLIGNTGRTATTPGNVDNEDSLSAAMRTLIPL